ncbi:MAG TPA: chorismate mutase [Anaerolineaceae bacterium]
MFTRGVRGATTIQNDQAENVLAATRELLEAIQSANPTMRPEDVASAWFTVTQDIHSVYPAKAARLMGWTQVPLMCSNEISVPGGLPLCIRVLLHWNTDLPQAAIRHVYLHDAVTLRPDLAATPASQVR